MAAHPSTPSTTRQLLGTLLPIVAVAFILFLVTGVALPVLPLYVHRDLGFGTFAVGLVAGAQFTAALLSRFWSGGYADARGARRATVAGLVLAVAAGLLYLASLRLIAEPGSSIATLLVGRAVLGAAESCVVTGALSWGLALAGPSNAGKAMSWVGLAMYVALAVGAPLGTALYAASGFAGVALAATLVPLVGLAWIARVRPVAPQASSRPAFTVVVGAVWRPGLGLALSSLGFGAITTFVVLLFAQRAWGHAWLGLTTFFAAFVAGRVAFGHLPDRVGGARIAFVSVIVEAAGLALIWLARSPTLVLVGAALSGFGYTLVYPGYGVEAVRRAPPESRGLAMGAYTAFLDLALGLANPALGLVASRVSVRAVFLVSALVVLCSAVIAARLAIRSEAVRGAKLGRVAAALLLCIVASRPARAEQAAGAPGGGTGDMEIKRSGTQPSQKGPAEYFTGTVRIDPLFSASDPPRASGAYVTFEPCARSAWHTHPLGQVLIVTAGVGRVQRWGGPVEEIRAGDVVWTPPGVKHWHGASPTTAMTHLAITEQLQGKAVEWMEKVTDEQYGAAVRPAAGASSRAPQTDDLGMVAPALARYADGVVFGDLWKRPDLSPRDRSLVTVAALIARQQTTEMAHYLELALDSGVRPGELSEVITHLAFYSGWANATTAAGIAKAVFARRGIGLEALPSASGDLLPLDQAAEAQRASRVEQDFGAVAPGVVHYTTDVLFRNLWLRPGLAARDRSLVTVSALVATGQVAQITYHLNRAMDNGLTRAQASEALTQLAFYAGWPNVFSAMPVAKAVFEKRP